MFDFLQFKYKLNSDYKWETMKISDGFNLKDLSKILKFDWNDFEK